MDKPKEIYGNQWIAMPLVFSLNGYRFFFYSNEGNPLEPCHIHVRKGVATAKFWVEGPVTLAESYEMPSHELRELLKIVENHRELIQKKWHEHFSPYTMCFTCVF